MRGRGALGVAVGATALLALGWLAGSPLGPRGFVRSPRVVCQTAQVLHWRHCLLSLPPTAEWI